MLLLNPSNATGGAQFLHAARNLQVVTMQRASPREVSIAQRNDQFVRLVGSGALGSRRNNDSGPLSTLKSASISS
jgi:hypothetical protein